MNKKELSDAIKYELENLIRLCREIDEIINRTNDQPTFIETRSAASVLHDFYSGIEKIFKRIAIYIDNDLPENEDWHTELLLQMSKPHKNRGAIINETLLQRLKEYLRFRHLFRHIYGFELKWEKIQPLCIEMQETFKQFEAAMNAFLTE